MLPDRIGFLHLREMAGRSEQVVGDIALADIDRLGDLLSDSFLQDPDADKRLHVDARFVEHGHGFPEVESTVTGFLPIDCQRCLVQLDWPVELRFSLALVESEEALEAIGDRFDAVVVDEHGFSLLDAVTDELLGSLPLAPMHADVSDCDGIEDYLRSDSGATGDAESHESGSPDDVSGDGTNRPFAGLAALVKGGGGDTTNNN